MASKQQFQGEYEIGGKYKLGRERTEATPVYDERTRQFLGFDYATSYKELVRVITKETKAFLFTSEGEQWKKTTILQSERVAS